MNTGTILLRYILAGLLLSTAATCQGYMSDTSSTYNAMWFDDTNVYVTGSIVGSLTIHRYRVSLTVQTPTGTYVSSYPAYASGFVQNTISAPWTARMTSTTAETLSRLARTSFTAPLAAIPLTWRMYN